MQSDPKMKLLIKFPKSNGRSLSLLRLWNMFHTREKHLLSEQRDEQFYPINDRTLQQNPNTRVRNLGTCWSLKLMSLGFPLHKNIFKGVF